MGGSRNAPPRVWVQPSKRTTYWTFPEYTAAFGLAKRKSSRLEAGICLSTKAGAIDEDCYERAIHRPILRSSPGENSG